MEENNNEPTVEDAATKPLADQPETEASAESAAPPPAPAPDQKPKKSKRNLVIIVVIALILVAGGAYFMFASEGNNSSGNNTDGSAGSEDSEAKPSTVKVLNVQSGIKLYTIDEAENLTELKETALDLQKLANEENFGPGGFAEYEGRLAFTTNVPDAETYEKSYEMKLRQLEGSVTDEFLIYNIGENHGPYTPHDWIDADTILLQEFACFDCGGGPIGIFHRLDVNSKEVTPLVDLASASSGNNGFLGSLLSNTKNYIAMASSTPTYFGPWNYEDYAGIESELVLYNLESDSVKKLFTPDNGNVLSVAGFDEKEENVLVEIRSYSDEGDDESVVLTEGIGLVSIANGSIRELGLLLSDFKDSSTTISSATTLGDTLFFTTSKFVENQFTYKLRAFDMTKSEFEVSTLLTTSDFIWLDDFEEITQ